MHLKDRYYWLGIDAGGTRCRVRLEDDNGHFLGEGSAGTGHPSHGMSIVADNIKAATLQAIQQAGLEGLPLQRIVASGGYAGLHLPRFQRLVMNWDSPFAHHYFTTDLHTACYGALDGVDGGVIILGTGFSAMANVSGKTHFIGGQGLLLGDVASGGWLGLQAVRYTLAWQDGMQPHSRMVELVQDTYQAAGVELADKLISAQSNEFARCAKELFTLAEENDLAAKTLICQAAKDASKVVAKLMSYGCSQVAMCGSVGKRLLDYMSKDFRTCIVLPIGNAEQGAIWYARQQWGNAQASTGGQKKQGNTSHVA